jgi:thiol-disulfide isomerase/thioredoxin
MSPADSDSGWSDSPSRRRLLAATGGLGATLLAGCTGTPGGGGDDGGSGDGGSSDDDGSGSTDDDGSGSTDGDGDGSTDGDEGVSGDGSGGMAAWRTTELTTVRGGESFTIEELSAPVLVQSFAVWCPKCQRQSEQLAGVADSVTVLGLNTDPNEDTEKVRNHAESNGFDWRFAVAPTGMTESLIDAFGITVTNAPSTPIIAACGDGSASFMSGGVQSTGELRSAAEDC